MSKEKPTQLIAQSIMDLSEAVAEAMSKHCKDADTETLQELSRQYDTSRYAVYLDRAVATSLRFLIDQSIAIVELELSERAPTMQGQD